jgi:hypothetical protein
MITGSVTVGRALAGVMVCTPLPEMLKAISSGALPGFKELACAFGVEDSLTERARPAVVDIRHGIGIGHNRTGGRHCGENDKKRAEVITRRWSPVNNAKPGLQNGHFLLTFAQCRRIRFTL